MSQPQYRSRLVVEQQRQPKRRCCFVDILRGSVLEDGLSDLLGSVWIVSSRLNTLSWDVFEDVVHETTFASLISEGNGAVNNLLFGEGDEFVFLLGVETFEGTSGGEGVAWTALLLVLDFGGDTLLSPVDGGWEAGVVEGFWFVAWTIAWRIAWGSLTIQAKTFTPTV